MTHPSKFILVLGILSACGTVPAPAEPTERITLNGLGDVLPGEALNTLAANRLALSSSTSGRYDLNPVSGLHRTAEGRDVLEYVARCALADGDVLEVQVGGTTALMPGLLGLAPHWIAAPLTAADRRRLSACLLAHVNAYGVSVPISVRGPGLADGGRAGSFTVYEGTFFGDVFSDPGAAYACRGEDRGTALAASPDRALRVCTDGSPGCPVTALGPCDAVCGRYEASRGWTACLAGGETFEETVSVFLRGADDAVETPRVQRDS